MILTMRIAVFSDTFYPKIDGIVTFILSSIDYLSKKGHKIAIFCPKYKQEGDRKFGKNIEIYRFFSMPLLTYKEVKIVFINMKKLFDVLEKFKPDIIHINTPGSIGIAGARCAGKLGIPLIGTYHTLISEQMSYISPMNLLGINWLLSKLGKKDMSTLKFLKKEESKSFLKKLGWYYSLKVYNYCDVIAAPSKAITSLLKKRNVKGKAIFLSNGIDLKDFRAKKKYERRNGLLLIHIGRISYEKSVDVVIKAVALAMKKSKEKIILNIGGSGPALKPLRKLVKDLGADSNIHLIGWVSGEELKNLYKKADAFITASTMETQGIVILEAMATGLPIIGVRKYAIPDIVEDNYNGFLAKPYDEADLSKAILKMLNNKSKLEYYGKNSLEIARKHELENCMRKLEMTYKEMTAAKTQQ